MADLSCLLLLDGPPADWSKAAQVLDRASKTLSKSDATKACRFGQGLLATELSVDEAEQIAQALTQAGFRAQAFPSSQIIHAPRPFTITNAGLKPDGLEVPTNLLGEMELLPWSCLRIVCVACVRANPTQTSDAMMWVSGQHETPQLEAVDDRPIPSNTEPEVLLELFSLQPLLRLRIRRRAFGYACLGARRNESSQINFRLLLAEILNHAPSAARCGFVTEALAERNIDGPRQISAPMDHERMITALLTREVCVGLPR